MSESAPRGEFPESFDENDLFLERPTLMDKANALARQLEDNLNAFNGSLEQRQILHHAFMPQLNLMSGIVGRMIVVNGPVRKHHIDPTTLDQNGMADVIVTDENVEDLKLESLGYRGYAAPEDSDKQVVIKQLAIEPRRQISHQNIFGVIMQADMYELPIDGSAHVQIPGEIMPPDIDLLRRTVPKLMERIDEALTRDSSDSLNNKLHGLAQIDLKEYAVLHGKGGADPKRELAYYINHNLRQYFYVPYHVTGCDVRFFVPNQKIGGVTDGIDLVCRIKGVDFSMLDRTQLALYGEAYVHGKGWETIIFDFSENLGVIPEEIRFPSPSDTDNPKEL